MSDGERYILRSWTFFNHHTVAEPLFALGYPRNTYVAQNFDCPDFAYGLNSCSYNMAVDSECFFGPHVAGVRCTESKNLIISVLCLELKIASLCSLQ